MIKRLRDWFLRPLIHRVELLLNGGTRDRTVSAWRHKQLIEKLERIMGKEELESALARVEAKVAEVKATVLDEGTEIRAAVDALKGGQIDVEAFTARVSAVGDRLDEIGASAEAISTDAGVDPAPESGSGTTEGETPGA